jgi:hypothetical protein
MKISNIFVLILLVLLTSFPYLNSSASSANSRSNGGGVVGSFKEIDNVNYTKN